MPRGRPKGSKNKAKATTTAKEKVLRTPRRKVEPAQDEPIVQPKPKVTAPELHRLEAKDIKEEKLVWNRWPALDVPVYIAGHGQRKFSFFRPFPSGTDDGVLLVDYARRHDLSPAEQYRTEARYVYYKPTAK